MNIQDLEQKYKELGAEIERLKQQPEGVTEREKFLMREAMKAATNYDYLEEWLNEVVDDAGHTVEQLLDHEAPKQEIK